MAYQFKHHFTLAEARALLPQVKQWLVRLRHLSDRLAKQEKRLDLLTKGGQDVGGETVNDNVRLWAEIKTVLLEFNRRNIQIKDLRRGLIDFPAIIGDREVFLCWEEDEEDIEFWHDLETGFAGRERLDPE